MARRVAVDSGHRLPQAPQPRNTARELDEITGVLSGALAGHADVVEHPEPIDIDVVLERRNLAAAERFDLVEATNIFVYSTSITTPSSRLSPSKTPGAMLKPGGVPLTNDMSREVSGGSMWPAGTTILRYGDRDAQFLDAVGWYRKQ